MPIPITMPRLSDTMEEGTLIKWRVSVGDAVNSGDLLADVETDKATMELQSFDDGTVARLAVEEGQSTAVGDLILVLAEDGESVEDAAQYQPGSADAKPEADNGDDSDNGDDDKDKASDKSPSDAKAPAAKAASQTSGASTATLEPHSTTSGRIRVSPVARKIAEENDLDLAAITGSGPGGRIIKRDVLAAIESGQAAASAPTTERSHGPSTTPAPVTATSIEAKALPLSNMRKTIARRLVESKTTIPHFTVTVAVNADPLLELRAAINQQLEPQGVKLSVNDFIVRAAALTQLQHPQVNASWDGDAIQVHGTVNVGVAVALPEEKGGGLVVPTLRNVQNKGLRQISQETRQLASKARDQGLAIEEMSDATFTVSNLGMFGVDHFEAIINPPNAAILAVGAAVKKPVVRDDQIVIGHEMTCTLSCDHRVVDGAMGAAWLATLRQLLESPAVMLV